MCAAARGHRVTLTDNISDALAFARLSQFHNNLANVQVEYLDWTAPNLPGKFAWIIGSDILYEKKNFEAILQYLARYHQPGGKIYLTQGIRGTGPKAFFDLIKPHYTVRYQEKKLHSGEDEKKILFFELQSKR